MLGAFADLGKKVDSVHRQMKDNRPLYRPVGGSAIGVSGVNPTLLMLEQKPAIGRAWNILSVKINGSDGHTPLGLQSGGSVFGSAAAPAANAVVASLLVGGGNWNLNWSVGVFGTTAAGDANNMDIRLNNTDIMHAMYNSAAGTVQTQTPFIQNVNQVGTFTINALAAASAGTTYEGQISATPASVAGALPQIYADVYAGDPGESFAGGNTFIPTVNDELIPAALIPSVTIYSKGTVWVHPGEGVFALVYGLSAGQIVTMAVRVAEYRLESVEAMTI